MKVITTLKRKIPSKLKQKIKAMINWVSSVGYAAQLIIYKKRVVVFDTPSYGNIGDQAILMAEIQCLRNNISNQKIICIPNECVDVFLRKFSFLIKCQDILFIQGGGFFGSLWKDEVYSKVISTFSKNEIIIFPQTIFYEDNEYGKKRLSAEQSIFDKKNVHFFVREENSFAFCQKELYKKFKDNCVLIPDIVLYYSTNISYRIEDRIILCLRNDKEKISSTVLSSRFESLAKKAGMIFTQTDMCVNYSIRKWKKKIFNVEKKLMEFSRSKFVVTDRLHCMIFCTLVGTPCIAMDNSSKKVKGVYEKWLKDLDYIVFCENENDALSKAQEWIKADSIKATRYSPKDLESAFAPLTQAIKDCLA